ncbi:MULTISPECIES: flagellar assembly peptidoglycan hydrolase FlgJ [Achromobacter]|jgi:flagellar protein FlgJ|uniref:Peptidoglycan hydrolase FlgJ n=2 Tax=Alcaligenes xylosoxydans xylosoxydans TaxID=85698 RepID=A0A0D6HCI5_ALCXX|nr:flagellar assembly peptidoglycan hydrolase FlgJ [Achromobacter xylosoxidans]AHC46910.1 Flagellar protein FlgJ [Achromobacter xylosoxidans NBRC 15126 = ATCC 27061]AMH06880.1 flagellar assembly peptidoglycan hydrolase FlgJ [Achromobacter xylosoxidans]AXA77431.1 flagellar assembly peptidoglycan hydrolase FlgJ [Achromobacter xylosoxidans]EFV86445.1 peptidoglycan hydrolase [Achromobacter xylosoxidans C54]KAA5924670.1 flagellar assembly peptidoglycan hydrolase FlgJ [Achromobacter xylosoxidans]
MAYTNNTARLGSRQDSVFDMGRLSDLKRDVTKDPANPGTEQQKQVAKQFEALFLQMMLKRMREATPKEGLFDSQQTQMLQSMADEQLALHLATPGIGLSQSILAQMQQGKPGDLPAEAVQRLGQGTDLDFQTGGSRQVSALMDVMRNNRASDRALAAAEGAPEHVINFVSKMSRAATLASQQSGVPARLIMGQAALESGWGQREIKHEDGRTSYNLFGIKAGPSWKGKVVNVLTTEYEDGVAKKVTQPFRAYSSYEESFADYARLIGNSPRYEAVTQARNEIEAARRIQSAGYATDPQYAQKLIGVMSQLRGAAAKVDISRQMLEGL